MKMNFPDQRKSVHANARVFRSICKGFSAISRVAKRLARKNSKNCVALVSQYPIPLVDFLRWRVSKTQIVKTTKVIIDQTETQKYFEAIREGT